MVIPPPITPAGSLAGSVRSAKVTVKRGIGVLNLGVKALCAAGTTSCRVRVSASGKKNRRAKAVSLGFAAPTVRPGGTVALKINLSTKALRALRKAKKLTMTVTIRIERAGSTTVSQKLTGTLKAPRR